MDGSLLEEELLRALRRAPQRSLDRLAEAVGLPRTNFGRALGHRLQQPVERLLDEGLIEEQQGRYSLSERGRRFLAERALAERNGP